MIQKLSGWLDELCGFVLSLICNHSKHELVLDDECLFCGGCGKLIEDEWEVQY